MGIAAKGESDETLLSDHRAHPRSCVLCSLRVRVNAHKPTAHCRAANAQRCAANACCVARRAHRSTTNHSAADTQRVGGRANESTANCRTNRRAADAHRAACCVARPTPN